MDTNVLSYAEPDRPSRRRINVALQIGLAVWLIALGGWAVATALYGRKSAVGTLASGMGFFLTEVALLITTVGVFTGPGRRRAMGLAMLEVASVCLGAFRH